MEIKINKKKEFRIWTKDIFSRDRGLKCPKV